jgi:hypothetical protein
MTTQTATNKERDEEQGKGHLAINTPPIVSQQEWEAAHQQLMVKERPSPAHVTPWPPNAGGCPGWLWTRSTSSTDPKAR